MLRQVALRLFVVVTAVHTAGCASDRAGATWADVDDSGVKRAPPPPDVVATAAPAPAATTTASYSAGVLIDRALAQFLDERVRARHEEKTSAAWADAWNGVFLAVGDAVGEAPRASDLGAFVRVRATLEVELERDKERGVLLPGDVDKRLATVLATVDESVGELRLANAPGTAPGLTPRLGDGELVLRSPLAPIIVNSPFGARSDPFTHQKRYHNGVDLDARLGDDVYAAAAGLVVFAGRNGGYGNQIVVDHGDGVRTHYSHLSKILVQLGQTVAEGDAIGLVGSTGRSTGPHLHFAVTNGVEFLDPLAVLDIPFSAIANQVKVGTEKERRSFALVNRGDTVEVRAVK